MKKCLKITLVGKLPEGFLRKHIQKNARSLGIEGTVQPMDDNTIRIVVCGEIDPVEELLDLIHKESAKIDFDYIEIEPFLKSKDYRGVFRVIE